MLDKNSQPMEVADLKQKWRMTPPDDGPAAPGRDHPGNITGMVAGSPRKGGETMPDKEKIAEVQALVDNLHILPETAQQRILGMVEGIQLARAADAADKKEKEEQGA